MVGLLDQTKHTKFRFYRAEVISNQDPKMFGRVQITIPDLLMQKGSGNDNWLWAYPANSSFGGGNTNMSGGAQLAGSMIVPVVGQWVWVFFENDNPNRPYYIGALNISNQQVPPETAQGSQWYNKWLLLRSPDGRAMWISDDPDDARVILTGKKRQSGSAVLPIVGNQSVILIDESNQERILIADHTGSYFLMQTDQSQAYWYTSNANGSAQMNIFTTNTMINLNDSGSITLQVSGSIIQISDGQINIQSTSNVNIKASGAINLDGSSINLNSGLSQSAQSVNVPNITIG